MLCIYYRRLCDHYKLQKSEHRKLVKFTKKSYYQGIISSSDNPTKFAWNLISEVCGNNCNKKNVSLKTNEEILVEEATTVATWFNVFFNNTLAEISVYVTAVCTRH